MPDDLGEPLTVLLERASATAVDDHVRSRLAEARDRLHGPLRLAIAGKVKAGKSTLLNALLGEEIAPTDAGECTKIVTWYTEGPAPQVVVHPLQGPPISRPWTRENGALEVDLGELSAADVDHIAVTWPTSRLRAMTILDTPGIASISADVSARTHRALEAVEGKVPVADAVLYLMRHTHASDVRFLEAFHDDELAHGTPMNSVGVLSRADEIGSCRLDALDVADRIARRYEADPRMRRLCPLVLPVGGLLAYASATLREAEYALLNTVARAPREAADELLLTADRFLSRPTLIPLTELEREHLLDRLGLFGVRLAVELIRTAVVRNAGELAAELGRRSGLDRLRSVILTQFEQRSRILKSRSALAVLNEVLRTEGCRNSSELRAAAEELAAGTHEFEEVRLLDAVRSGIVELPADRLAELDQLLGGGGHDPASRLGVEPDSDNSQLRMAALTALARWQRIAEHPLYARQVQLAARTATRTLEGLLNQLS